MVLGVAVVAVILPIIFHIVSSPFLLFLISPLVVLLLALLFLTLNVLVGHFLDKRPSSYNDLHHAANPFAFSTPAAWQAVLTRSQWSQNTPQSFPPLCPDAPHLSTALNDILIMIVRDFVLTWYKELSPSPSFPMAVSLVLHDSLGKLLDRAAGIDIPALIVKRILPKITAHVEQFRQSEIALRGAGLERKLTQSEELDMLLASRYATKGIGRLHPAIENLSTTFTQQTEQMHLRQLIEKALPHVLPEKESKSRVYKLVVREVLVCVVLQPLMDMVSDPDFCNRVIDQVVCRHTICTYGMLNSLLFFRRAPPFTSSKLSRQEGGQNADVRQKINHQSTKRSRGPISSNSSSLIHRHISACYHGVDHYSHRYSSVRIICS
jgi:sorting nexin-25